MPCFTRRPPRAQDRRLLQEYHSNVRALEMHPTVLPFFVSCYLPCLGRAGQYIGLCVPVIATPMCRLQQPCQDYVRVFRELAGLRILWTQESRSFGTAYQSVSIVLLQARVESCVGGLRHHIMFALRRTSHPLRHVAMGLSMVSTFTSATLTPAQSSSLSAPCGCCHGTSARAPATFRCRCRSLLGPSIDATKCSHSIRHTACDAAMTMQKL